MQPIWKWLPAGLAHELAPLGLSFYANFFGSETSEPWDPFTWRGLHFPNRIGVAGGVDKNAEATLAWQRAGAGFVEVGTVTPQPQFANPGKIIDRDWDRQILWNRMGFPNRGQDEVFFNLKRAQGECHIPVFINIGKNRTTSNDMAYEDYRDCAKKLAPLASALVVNVSSPNTGGLRDLQSEENLKKIIHHVRLAAPKVPVLIKLSPDQTAEQLEASLMASLNEGALGFILTNTTLARPPQTEGFPKEGGLSGLAVAEKSKWALKQTLAILGDRRQGLLLVSTGGLLRKEDIKDRLALGADLVQVYSALVFNGPGFFRRLKKGWNT